MLERFPVYFLYGRMIKGKEGKFHWSIARVLYTSKQNNQQPVVAIGGLALEVETVVDGFSFQTAGGEDEAAVTETSET